MSINQALVIGLGNEYRSDDAVGHAIARKLKASAGNELPSQGGSGECGALMDTWKDADFVVLIDAVESGGPAGNNPRMDANDGNPKRVLSLLAHGFRRLRVDRTGTSNRPASRPSHCVRDRGKKLCVGRDLTPEVRRPRTRWSRVRRELEMNSVRQAGAKLTMKTQISTIDANEAVARIAYALNEVIALYPITPATPMGEWADQWAADGVRNLWGTIPSVIEMQSEGGAAGAIHGRTADRCSEHDVHRIAGSAPDDSEHVQDRGRADGMRVPYRCEIDRGAGALDLRRPQRRDGRASDRLGDALLSVRPGSAGFRR